MDFSEDLFLLPISGGGENDFLILKLADYDNAVHGTSTKQPIILVTDAVIGITIDTLDAKTVLAVNGPATLKTLNDLPATHTLNEYIFKNTKKINKAQVVPQQIAFIAAFNQLFFIGHAKKLITGVTLSSAFKDKFESLKTLLETANFKLQSVEPKIPEDAAQMDTYFKELQTTLGITASLFTYSDLQGWIISARLKDINDYIKKGEIAKDTDTNVGFNIEEPEEDYEQVCEDKLKLAKAEHERELKAAKEGATATTAAAVADIKAEAARRETELEQEIAELTAGARKFLEKGKSGRQIPAEAFELVAEKAELARKLKVATEALADSQRKLALVEAEKKALLAEKDALQKRIVVTAVPASKPGASTGVDTELKNSEGHPLLTGNLVRTKHRGFPQEQLARVTGKTERAGIPYVKLRRTRRQSAENRAKVEEEARDPWPKTTADQRGRLMKEAEFGKTSSSTTKIIL